MNLSILFSSAGRRSQLIECFRNSARLLGINLRCLAADLRPTLSAACAIADQSFQVPRCTAPDFIARMLSICEQEQVKLIVPTIDTELEVLAAHQELFANIGTAISISSPSVVGTCRNKLHTARFLQSIAIPVPRTGLKSDLDQQPNTWQFPLIAKPIAGSSSVGLQIVHSLNDLSSVPPEGYIIQEVWKGTEYTVNLFFGRDGLVCAVPHRRIEVRGGEVSKGRTERVPALLQAARMLGDAWKHEAFGALCFQAIVKENGEAAVFEINARFGGGYPLAHHAGAQFSKWLLEQAAGLPSSAMESWKENVLMLRYDSAVFRDAPVL